MAQTLVQPQSTANQTALDQLTAAATMPPVPPTVSINPNVSSADQGTGFVPTPLAAAPASTTGSTANLDSESDANSPSDLAARVLATQKTEQNDNPSFLQKLGRVAAGAGKVGLTVAKDAGKFGAGLMGVDPDSFKTPEGAGQSIMSILGRIGGAGALAMGTPEQKQLAVEQEQIPLKLAQIKNERDYRNALIANNATKAGIAQQNADTKGQTADQQGTLIGSKIPQTQTDTALKQFQLETLKNGQFPVDAVTAQLTNRPDLAGKAVSGTMWQEMNKVLQARGLHVQDLGADGLWTLDREGNKIHQISEISPSVARGESYNKSKPVQALDANGVLRYMPAGEAEAQGAAPAAQGSQVMSKQAQFKDIYSGLAAARHAVAGIGQEPLDAPTIAKLTLATRETDPTIAHQAFDTILGSQNLTPAQQDFVIAIQQLNERALSLRNLAGMGNGSDQMRAAIRATLPSAKSGNPQIMLKQLDAVTNLVDNLYSGVPKIKQSATPTATPATGGKQSFSDFMAKKGK